MFLTSRIVYFFIGFLAVLAVFLSNSILIHDHSVEAKPKFHEEDPQPPVPPGRSLEKFPDNYFGKYEKDPQPPVPQGRSLEKFPDNYFGKKHETKSVEQKHETKNVENKQAPKRAEQKHETKNVENKQGPKSPENKHETKNVENKQGPKSAENKQGPKSAGNINYNFVGEGDMSRKDFNFAAAGDIGCSINAKNTVSNMKDKKPELVLPLGDLSYDKTASCWLDLISPFSDKLKLTLGFHDVKDGASKLNQYQQSFGLDKLYGSFDYRHVHFLTMASESEFLKNSTQYKFVDEDLKKASENKDIDWIVVTTYGPFYTSPSTHKAEKDLRDIYHPLFEKYNVDLVLQAHNHNYQRTYPISFNSAGDSSKPFVTTNQNTTRYNNHTDGTVFALVGTGGEGFYPLSGQAPYVANQFDGKFGFLDIGISNGNPHTKLTGTFYDNKDYAILDQFAIEKEIRNIHANSQSEPPSSSDTSHTSQTSANSNSNRDYLPSCSDCNK